MSFCTGSKPHNRTSSDLISLYLFKRSFMELSLFKCLNVYINILIMNKDTD